jgi:glycosyltransferase involved in cell wall biosynthesis
VVSVTRTMLASIEEHYGWLPATRVIAHGRDPACFSPTTKKEELVFAAGRISDEATNLACVERLDVPWPVYLAGEAREPSPRRLGKLSPRATAAWMSRASIYAFPALYEPFGLSVLEAALSGCALVLGDIPSLRELWGTSAMYVDPRDDHAIAHAISTLVHDRQRRQELARRARLRATHYDLAATVAAYLSLYTDLCEALPGSRCASGCSRSWRAGILS